jgi:hypothetical protein
VKYAVEMGSSAMIHIPSFIKIGSGIQKLTAGRHTDKQIVWRSRNTAENAITAILYRPEDKMNSPTFKHHVMTRI